MSDRKAQLLVILVALIMIAGAVEAVASVANYYQSRPIPDRIGKMEQRQNAQDAFNDASIAETQALKEEVTELRRELDAYKRVHR